MANRALVLTGSGPESLTVEERPVPAPERGQALVRLRASCLNYRDYIMTGSAPREPRVPLSDGCGEVVAVGADVTRVAPGDRVAPNFFPRWIGGRATQETVRPALGGDADGCAQQHLLVDADALALAPAYLSDLEVATLPCAGVTAWNALLHPRLLPGETVLVQGTGGVSIFALQLAKAMGAQVIITSSSDQKLERARELGADHGINYRTHPEWDREVLDCTGGRGADLIVEVGGQETFPRAIKAAALGGRISAVGGLSGFGAAEFAPRALFGKQLEVYGIYVGSREDFDAMNRALELHQLRPVISDSFSLWECAKALDLMGRGEHFGKIALEID